MKKLLFVCLGNICRSPAAEAVMVHLVEKEGLSDQIFCDSAGTSAFHAGEKADSRMRATGKGRGIPVTSISRKFVKKDFDEFDYIIAMDSDNYENIMRLDPEKQFEDKVHMMTDFGTGISIDYVPDPYYGGDDGFEQVFDLVTNCSEGLLSKVKKDL